MGFPDRREFRASFLSNGDGIVYKDGVFGSGIPPSLNADGLAPQIMFCFVLLSGKRRRETPPLSWAHNGRVRRANDYGDEQKYCRQ